MSENEQSLPVDETDGHEDEVSKAYAEAFGEQEPVAEATPEPEPAPPVGDSGQDPAGQVEVEPVEAKKQEDLEELRKKAHGYESMLGRLRKEQEERKRLEAAMAQQQQRQGQVPPQQAQQPPAQMQNLPRAEIPEDIRDEAKAFERDNPELAPLLYYPGREGEKLRKLLADFGPDVAEIHGNSVMAQYRLAQAESQFQGRLSQSEQRLAQQQQEMQARLENERRQTHYTRIYSEVPDYAALATDPSRRQDLEQFHASLTEWVESKPHRDATQLFGVLKQGDAASVVNILKQFQQENQHQTGKPGTADAARRSAAMAATAVPSRGGAPPRGRADPNDEYAAFREAFGSG